MVNKYIEDLLIETDEEIERLQHQMAELLNDLKYSQEKQEKMQRERNQDTNIFSPRSMTREMNGKLEKAKEEVKVNNQRIEYIRERIEISTKKKLEYQTLLDELQERNSAAADKKEEEKDKAEKKNEDETLEFLEKLYKSTEMCLAFVNGDKNRCRNELKKMKTEIKGFAEKIENK